MRKEEGKYFLPLNFNLKVKGGRLLSCFILEFLREFLLLRV
jgi:hypothetical protein